MIRLALRQFRTPALVALAGLVAIAISLRITVYLYDTAVAGCAAQGDCSTRIIGTNFFTTAPLVLILGVALLLLPGIIGIFWGAPLVAREVEAGTYRLAWTQSITRTYWLAAKLGVFGVASMAMGGLSSLMTTYWISPIYVQGGSPFSLFDQTDVAPIAYAAFAFVLGATAGLIIRRSLPAMAATAIVFTATRLVVEFVARPNFAPPITLSQTYSIQPDGGLNYPMSLPVPADGWVVSSNTLNAAGQVVNNLPCNPGPGAATQAFQTCLAQYRQVAMYQPASHYWSFQWFETAIFLGLTLILVGFCFWWVRHRLS